MLLHAARRYAFMAALALLPSMAAAAPFCVAVQGLPDQCIYADGHLCQARADQMKGVCIINQAEVAPAVGPERFCLVIGNQATQCIYADRTSCTLDALKQHTACVQTINQPGSSKYDPYAIRRPY